MFYEHEHNNYLTDKNESLEKRANLIKDECYKPTIKTVV